jgi:RNase P subunit RPR2
VATLEERFEQAATVRRSRASTPNAQKRATDERLDELHRVATEGDPAQREAAMRHYIELVGDMQQQDA